MTIAIRPRARLPSFRPLRVHLASGRALANFRCFLLPSALALCRSRGSPTSLLSSPVIQANAAMRVQPSALGRKAIQYIVLYCLTPPRFHRYSSFNLCPPYPAWGENLDGKGRAMHRFRRRGNPSGKHLCPAVEPSLPKASRNSQLTTGNWQLLFPRSKRCSN